MFTEVPSAMGNCLLHSIRYWTSGRGGKLLPILNICLSLGLCTTFASLAINNEGDLVLDRGLRGQLVRETLASKRTS